MSHSFAKNAFFALLLVVIVMMNTIGIFSAGMMMEDAAMHNCPFMGVPALCDMSPLQHLSQWQQMFATTVQQFSTAALLLLLALVAWFFIGKLSIPKRTKILIPRYRYQEGIFDPLQLAFARGIIHTKVF